MTVHLSPNTSPGTASRRRRSGSILIIVVALLTLVALIGTALIATARVDRYSARAYVRTASLDAIHNQLLDQVESEVERTLLQDTSTDVDSFFHDTWLAERLPIANPSIVAPAPRSPMWAYISGRLATTTDANAYLAGQAPYTDYQPPYQPNAGSPVSTANFLRLNPVDAAHLANPAIPTSISLTYPANHPVESIRNKTRTFPALKFTDFTGATDNGTFLAADADGDGIADSVLRQMTPAPIDGVTYYYAIRIVDNASAINVNTAWSRDDEFLFPPATNQRTFFTSNIGLYELLSPKTDATTSRVNRDNEITALNEYRLGYGSTGYPTTPSFNPFTDSGALPTLTTDQDVIADADANATYGNGGVPTKRNDYAFASQAEALDTQLAWRLENPGYRAGVSSYTPASSRDITSPSPGSPFQFAAYSASDGTSLAYRFCMIDPDVAPTDVESRLLISAYQSAPNYVGVYGSPNLPNWKFYPADRAVRWFQWLDYDNTGGRLDANNEFDEYNASGAASGTRRFPSIRPLLTTWNPVSDRITIKSNTAFSWDRSGSPTSTQALLHPGMMYNDVKSSTTTRYQGTWDSTKTYKYGDIVLNPNDGLYYMFVWGANGNSPQAPDTYFPPNPPPTLAAGQTRADYWDLQPYVSGQTKTSVNTSGFPELWRAYFETMTDATGTAVPTVIGTAVTSYLTANGATSLDNPYLGMTWNQANMQNTSSGHPAAMFRSPIRSPEAVATPPHKLTPYQTAVLRSALAAVNTIDLRNSNAVVANQDITAKTFTLYDTVNTAGIGGTPNNPVPQYRVTVYGTKQQPYITEVYANNDATDYTPIGPIGSNPTGYVAIELYNPYNAPIALTNWRMASFDRRVPSGAATDYATAGSTLTEIIQFSGAVFVPANGYLIIENYQAGATVNGSATYRPPSTSLPRIGAPPAQANVQYAYAPLGMAMDREIVLLRPRVAGANVPLNQITDMVPVDQYDLTGLSPSTSACQTWHYARPTQNWQFVYPGRYNASVAYGTPRQQGTYATTIYNPTTLLPPGTAKIGDPLTYDEWNPPSPPTDNPPFGSNAVAAAVPGQPVTLGGQVSGAAIVPFSPANTGATYLDTFAIQLANVGMPGPNPVTDPTTGSNLYPLGTFSRNGDILQVPFIGAYKIELVTASASPGAIDPGAWPAGYVPADGNAANPSILDFNAVTLDSAFAEDTITTNNTVSSTTGGECVGRFCPPLVSAGPSVYDWAKQLFNYLDVRTASNDYLPNFDPGSAPYRAQSKTPFRPQPVANKSGLTPNPATLNTAANQTNEDYAARQGRLNVNTAPAAALAMVPFVAAGTSKPDVIHSKAVADAIALFRSTTGSANNGEFTSLFDLNLVPKFCTGDSTLTLNTLAPTTAQGDFTPIGGAQGDFEAQYLTLNRVSNLLTTRSDCFTVYILVQGWREAGTPFPVLDWEQRAAYIMDRSSGSITATPVPTD